MRRLGGGKTLPFFFSKENMALHAAIDSRFNQTELISTGASISIFQSAVLLLLSSCSPLRPLQPPGWSMLRSRRSFYIWTSQERRS